MDAGTAGSGETLGHAADRQPVAPGLKARYRAWRARQVARPGFRRIIQRLPGMRRYAGAREQELFSIVTGFVQSQILFVALESGLLDALKSGPVARADLPDILGFESPRLSRLLQATEALQLVARSSDGFVTLDDFGAIAVSDPGLSAMIRHHACLYRDLSDPVALFDGSRTQTEMRRIWSYAGEGREKSVSRNEAEAYSALMAASQSLLSQDILDAYDFSRHRRVLDIGGGDGTFLTALAERHPGLSLSLFDLPPVAARARERFADEPLSASPRCFGGNFLTDRLPEGHDCVTLVRVLFDHADETVTRLLANLRLSMVPGSRLVIAEPMAGRESPGARAATAYFGVYVMAMGSGRCRTPEEIGALALQAGFSGFAVRPCRSPISARLVVVER